MLTPTQRELDALLKELISWRSLNKEQVIARLEAKPEHIEFPINYQRLQNLTSVKNPAKHPARFAFQDDKLVLIVLGDQKALAAFSMEDIEAVVPGKPNSLKSRAGKASAFYVYPELGLSFTESRIEQHKIQYIEVFQPQTLESYKSTIYEEPAPSPYD